MGFFCQFQVETFITVNFFLPHTGRSTLTRKLIFIIIYTTMKFNESCQIHSFRYNNNAPSPAVSLELHQHGITPTGGGGGTREGVSSPCGALSLLTFT